MKNFMRKLRKKAIDKQGMTLLEVIITIGILGIIISIVTVNVLRLVEQAYMSRANDTAKVVYMALQSGISDAKTRGEFDDLFAESRRKENATSAGDYDYDTVPNIVIDGGTVEGIKVPGVTGADGKLMPDAERTKLKNSKDLVYMQISQTGHTSQLFKELIDPYISDKGIMNYTLIAEVNLKNKTVRSVFYSERTVQFRYLNTAGNVNKEELKSKANVLMRTLMPLEDKGQGYYGNSGIGADENISELENAYVKVLNDDMLAIEWGEIGPAVKSGTAGVTAEKRKTFAQTSYDISIVNANDTSKVYYKLENVSAYKKGETYLDESVIRNGQEILREGAAVRSPMPVYDLYKYGSTDGVAHGFDKNLMVKADTRIRQADGTMKLDKNMKHRLSYFVPADIGGAKQYGTYRLVLDSITSDKDDPRSISKQYPSIPWDENFKVIVTGKYKGEGFTGSMSISEDEDNGYVSKKTLNPAEMLYVQGVRGANVQEELTEYVKNKINKVDEKSNMWYEVAYARQLNNLRHILGYKDPTGTVPANMKNGSKQNVMLTQNIDWSIQQLGNETIALTGNKTQTIHRLTVSNVKEIGGKTNVQDTTTENLREFNPITTADAKGFEGKFLSAAQRDKDKKIVFRTETVAGVTKKVEVEVKRPDGTKQKVNVPVYNTFEIAYLRLAGLGTGAKDHIGLFDKVGQNGHLRDVSLMGITAYGKDYVGAFAGEFEGYAQRLTAVENREINVHKRIKKSPLGISEEPIPGVRLEPYQDAGTFKGNQITATGNYAGGMFGTVSPGGKTTLPTDAKSGMLNDIANGTRMVSLYDGEVRTTDETQTPNTHATNQTVNAVVESLDGINVKAKNYAGGLIGEGTDNVVLRKVVNTGVVEATENYAGGLAGSVGTNSKVTGINDKAVTTMNTGLDGLYVQRAYKYQVTKPDGTKENKVKNYEAKASNYGTITARDYAGGLFGAVEGATSVVERTELRDIANAGAVHSKNSYAGGIIGAIGNEAAVDKRIKVNITNAVNQAEVVAEGAYSGGIIGYAMGNTQIEGVQNRKVNSNTPMLSAVTGKGERAEIYGGNYVGGIVGYAGKTNTGAESLKIKKYRLPYELPGQIAGTVIAVSNGSNVRAAGDCAGGIAGEIAENTMVNPGVPNVAVSFISSDGAVEANRYAGGIVGTITDNAIVDNAKNSSTVKANADYAGGLAGRMLGESKIHNNKDVVLSDKAYTNTGGITATKNGAGGIVGLIGSATAEVINVFNNGLVTASGDYAGGLVGEIPDAEVGNSRRILHEIEVLNGLVIPDDQKIAAFPTNKGNIKANNYAGGIVGTTHGRLINVYNSGQVTATVSGGGGIAGQIQGESNKNALAITYTDEYDTRMLNRARSGKNTIYSNSGLITAGADAGGIVGVASNAFIENVMNAGPVTTATTGTGNNAGGIVGRLSGQAGVRNSVEGSERNQFAKQLTDSEGSEIAKTARQFNNSGKVTTTGSAAGGIVGKIEAIDTSAPTVYEMFNGGVIKSNQNDAGGIVGFMHGHGTIGYSAVFTIASILPNRYYGNQNNVEAVKNNAGGIVGRVIGTDAKSSIISCVYSGSDKKDFFTVTATNNAGGIAGMLKNATISSDGINGEDTDLEVYTNNASIHARNSNAGGVVGNADATETDYSTKDIEAFNKITTGGGVKGNDFSITKVSNEGTISADKNNAGGIFGVAGAGTLLGDEIYTNRLISETTSKKQAKKSMRTNDGNITAGDNNAGGIFGFASEKFDRQGNGSNELTDLFNGGTVTAKYNAGGIAGKAIKLDLRYTEQVLQDGVQAGNPEKFVFTNEAVIKVSNSNVGGIIGDANLVSLEDVFNSGIRGYEKATKNEDIAKSAQIIADGHNAGGLVGRAKNLSITNSKGMQDKILADIGYVYTNLANVTAKQNVGGILGYGTGGIQLVDAYNAGQVQAQENNAGGLVGQLEETGKGTITDINNKTGAKALSGIDLNKTSVIRTTSSGMSLDVEAGEAVSYITYQTLTSKEGTTTNRHSNSPKQALIDLSKKRINEAEKNKSPIDMIKAKQSAGGIIGKSKATSPDTIRIENVFNEGATYTDKEGTTFEMLGIRAMEAEAGGLIGHSSMTNISYSFGINPGNSKLDTDSNGDHSTFAQAFNNEDVRKDPYVVISDNLSKDKIPLHMVSNSASVRAQVNDVGDPQGGAQATVDFATGKQKDEVGYTAGGAVGYMEFGRIERVYSLEGSVVSPRNVGGVVGHSKGVTIKQVSRMNGENILLPTTLNKDILMKKATLMNRGSQNVGGIVGLAENETKIYDVRNFAVVQGRDSVGGIIGQASSKTEIVLAQNGNAVMGTSVTAADAGGLEISSEVLDRAINDGSYVGGIVGRADHTMKITMTKNDPLITNEFSKLKTQNMDKWTAGGNEAVDPAVNNAKAIPMVSGNRYVGGITGYSGIINYGINTGRIFGAEYLGGLSGQGYRLVNAYNTGNVIGDRRNLYGVGGQYNPTVNPAQYIGGIAGQLGTKNIGQALQEVQKGAYIQNVFNSSQKVTGEGWVGGIVGVAVAPINVTYSAATISTGEYTGTASSGSIGGLVGTMEQHRKTSPTEIKISNSYCAGAVITAATQKGAVVGSLAGFNDATIGPSKRISNCYYIGDENLTYYNSASTTMGTDINNGMLPIEYLNYQEDDMLSTLVDGTDAIQDADNKYVAKTKVGRRQYTSMVRNTWDTNGGTSASNSITGKGREHLKNPLNAKLTTNTSSTIADVKDSNATLKDSESFTARFIYPKADKELKNFRDYEFPQMDFTGNAEDMDSNGRAVALGKYTDELPENNQVFTSGDYSEMTNFYNYWPTKMTAYLESSVAYNKTIQPGITIPDSNDNSVYNADTLNNQTPNGNANNITIQYRSEDNYPIERYSTETLSLRGKIKNLEVTDKTATQKTYKDLPDYINFNVYDGHSRGEYQYDNTKFTNVVLPKSAVQTYMMVNETVYTGDFHPPADAQRVKVGAGATYFFYKKNISQIAGTGNEIDKPKLHVTVGEYNDTEKSLTIEIRLNSAEMQTYGSSSSGYHTMEATMVGTSQLARPEQNKYSVSRMFSMHFSNDEINETHNQSIVEKHPDLDFDDLTKLEYPVTDTAGLGGTLLQPTKPGSADYKVAVSNKLQVRNERHLYNINQGDRVGIGGNEGTRPTYLSRDLELKNNIQMSGNPGEGQVHGLNGFVIGVSNNRTYRFTGSFDGNGKTIGNIQVNRNKYPSTNFQDNTLVRAQWKVLPEKDYALFADVSGGIVKNLNVGADSKIIAENAAGLAYYVSNGRTTTPGITDPYRDPNNPLLENLGSELPKEVGTDTKIYDITVAAKINAKQAGGIVYRTARRFSRTEELPKKDTDVLPTMKAATLTGNTYAGVTNVLYNNNSDTGDQMAKDSTSAAGILCFASGDARIEDLVDLSEVVIGRTNYASTVEINDSKVADSGYVYAADTSSGILGLAEFKALAPQLAIIRTSSNNGSVVAGSQANGISQGIIGKWNGQREADDEYSRVEVSRSYNNGLVQTPDSTGLASGIGNSITTVQNSANNGSVFGKIASGITNYGDIGTEVSQVSNNGYVQGTSIAGGVTATPSRIKEKVAIAEQAIHVRIERAYNAGQVVVTSNEDNRLADGNSYAGGIIGYAASPGRNQYTWQDDLVGRITEDDTRKTIVRDSYNVGTVRYVDNYQDVSGDYSYNNRNLGGIVGGGLNQFVDVRNSYNLSDAQVSETSGQIIEKVANLAKTPPVTGSQKTRVNFTAEVGRTGYNYKLGAVGDTTYGVNVTNMSYADMQVLDNFEGFDNSVWTVDRTAEGANNVIYPYPQLINAENAPKYVGDKDIAKIPDYRFNVAFNEERRGKDITVSTDRMNSTKVTAHTTVASKISYSKNPSEYAITISGYTPGSNYQVRVYDGDATSRDYAPILSRSYEIRSGKVTSGGKLHSEMSTTKTPMEYFDPANVTMATNGKLTIRDKEELGYYMPIHGYYTVVVMKENGVVKAVKEKEGLLDKVRNLLEGKPTVMGTSRRAVQASERFQIHFGGENADGSNIEQNTGTYSYTAARNPAPYVVTDQYSVVGLTTSGIARNSTDNRIYKQSVDIEVNVPFYSIYEFNGTYDGNDKTLKRADKDAGFISLLRSTKKAGSVKATVKNLKMDVTAVDQRAGNKMSNIGKYLESTNYVGNLGLITDYMEAAVIDSVTVNGRVMPQAYAQNIKDANLKKYLGDVASDGGANDNNNDKRYARGHAFAGIAAVVTDGSTISNSRNNAELSVALVEKSVDISLGNNQTIKVPYEEPAGILDVNTAGIAGYVNNSKLVNVSNNGKIHSSNGARQAAGLVHTLGKQSTIEKSMNGGEIGARDGIAAGLVVREIQSALKTSYNSGKITGLALNNNQGQGTAIGCVAETDGGSMDQMYNSGMLVGRKRAAITQSSKTTAKLTNVYYLKDENLYWGDSTALPNYPSDYVVEDEAEVQLYLGFARNPTETFGFTDVNHKTYVTTPGNVNLGQEEVYNDPYAVTYRDFSTTTATKEADRGEHPIDTRGFDFTTWEIKDPLPKNNTLQTDNNLIRDYGKDYYPLPELRDNQHKTRDNLDFPLLLGEAQEVGRAPYKDTDGKAKYIPLAATAGVNPEVPRDTETFLDTIEVDLTSMSTTSKYEVLVYDGNSQFSDSKSVDPKLRIVVERKYLDIQNLGNLGEITNPNNFQYSNIYATQLGGYYYEVLAIAGDGTRRPAVFKTKAFVNNKNEILFNNNILDKLPEPSKPTEPYYSATVVDYKIPGQPATNKNKFYSKFSPHFANATETQVSPWTYGDTKKPYEILTQRNLMNIGKGGVAQAGVPPPSTSHYLASAYEQKQDVTMEDKKKSTTTSAVAVLEGIQPTLWTTNSGIGTTAIDFSGQYTARAGPSGVNTPPPRYKIIENLSTQNSPGRRELFNGLSKDAVVSDLNYAAKAGTQYIAQGENALIARKSAGTIRNIEISSASATTQATLVGDTQDSFGLIVGTMAPEGTSSTPKLEQILISNKVTVESKGSTSTTAGSPALATVAGSIKGKAIVEKVESNAPLNARDTGLAGKTSSYLGGIVGSILPSDTGEIDIKLDTVTYNGALTVTNARTKQIGGIIGGVTKSTNPATNNALSMTNVHSKKKITLASQGNIETKETSAGGILGYVESCNVSIKDSAAVGGIENGTGIGIAMGGIIGQMRTVKELSLDTVQAGNTGVSDVITTTVHASKGISQGGIVGLAKDTISAGSAKIIMKSVSNYNNLKVQDTTITDMADDNNSGGFIGLLSGYQLSVTDSQNHGQLEMKDSNVTAGGIVGAIQDSKALILENVQNTGDVKITGSMNGTAGGIVGHATNTEQFRLAQVTAGTTRANAAVSVMNATKATNVGGIVGKAQTDSATAHIELNGVTSGNTVTNNTTATEGISTAGGLIGSVDSYEVDISNSTNQRGVSITSQNPVAAGGIIGELKNGRAVSLEDTTSGVSGTTASLTANGKTAQIGGLIGWVVPKTQQAEDNKMAITGSKSYNEIAVNNLTTGSSTAGGLIGKVDDYLIIMSGGHHTGNISAANTTSGTSDISAGGLIGITGSANVVIYRSDAVGNVAITNAKKGTAGGLIGNVDGVDIAMQDSQYTGNVTATNQTSGTSDISAGGLIGITGSASVAIGSSDAVGNVTIANAKNGTAGGIVGHAMNTEQFVLTEVTAGKTGVKPTVSVTNATQATNVGGIVGKAQTVSETAMIQLDTVTSGNTLTSSTTATGGISTAGGLIGSVDSYEVDINNSTNERGGSITSQNPVAAGGIIGELKNGRAVSLVDTTSGVSGTTASLTANGTAAQIGGLIGWVVPKVKTADNKMMITRSKNYNTIAVDGTSNYTESGGTQVSSAVGGLIGHVNGYAVDMDGNQNTGNVSANNKLNVLGSASVGGLIGYVNNPQASNKNVSIKNSSSEGNIQNVTGNGNDKGISTGGIVGYLENIKEITLDTVHSGVEDADLTGDGIVDPLTSETKGKYGGSPGNASEAHTGGFIGRAVSSETGAKISINKANNYNTITAEGVRESSTVGGMAGLVEGYELSIIESNHYRGTTGQFNGSAKTNKSAAIGGMVGRIKDGYNVTFKEVTAGMLDPSQLTDQTKSTVVNIVGNANPVYAGGMIGDAVVTSKTPDTTYKIEMMGNTQDPDKMAAVNYSNMAVATVADGSTIGGIIGRSDGYEINMDATKNQGNIKVVDLGDESDIDIGGLIAQVKKAKIKLQDKKSDKKTNLENQGNIEIGIKVANPNSTVYEAGKVRAAGGIGYMEGSKAEVKGFSNTGDITITGDNQDANVLFAGIIASAQGVKQDDPTAAVSIQESLNAGKLLDNRTVLTLSADEEQARLPRVTGTSKAAGIVANTETAYAGEIRGIVVSNSHNAGALKANTAAGIIHTVVGDESIKLSTVENNINVGAIDVADEHSGFNITQTAALPVGQDANGDKYDGKGQLIAGAEAPKEVSPDNQPVIVKHYNIALEDMVRPVQTPPSETEPLAVDSITLRLAEMQDLTAIQTKSGWDASEISLEGDTVAPGNTSKWMMQPAPPAESTDREYLLPVVRTNAYVPDETVNYTEKAVDNISIGAKDGDGSYKVEWTYEDVIDDAKDGFGLIISSADGVTQRILQLKPGVAQVEDPDEASRYSYTVKESQIANVTNAIAEETSFKISVAAMRGENERYARSVDTDMILQPTENVTDDSEDVVVVVEKPLIRMSAYAYSSDIGRAVVEYALTRLGDPYSMPLAGQGNYLDCSYLTMMSYRSVGINLPRTAAEQAKYCVDNGFTISKEELMPGDLIFYSYQPSGRFMSIGHVAVYAGDGMIVEAGSTQGKVVYGPSHSANQQVLYGRPYVNTGISAGNAQNVSGAAIGTVDSDELYLLAQMIGLEAGGEGREGMIAVAEVIRNRMNSGKFPSTIAGVVSQSGQFEPYYKVGSYTPTAEQLQIAKEVMESGLSILNNPNCLYFCSQSYYESTGIHGFWGNMQIIAEYGNCFFIP